MCHMTLFIAKLMLFRFLTPSRSTAELTTWLIMLNMLLSSHPSTVGRSQIVFSMLFTTKYFTTIAVAGEMHCGYLAAPAPQAQLTCTE